MNISNVNIVSKTSITDIVDIKGINTELLTILLGVLARYCSSLNNLEMIFRFKNGLYSSHTIKLGIRFKSFVINVFQF